MAKYHLIASNGGVRKTYDNVSDVQVVENATVRIFGSVDSPLLTTQTMAIVRLGDGERLERAELLTQGMNNPGGTD